MEDRLRYLFSRYLDNSCTYQEMEEFLSYTRDAENDEALRELIRKVFSQLSDLKTGSTHVDEKGRLVLTEPQWLPHHETPVSIKRYKWRHTLSLAAMLILMAGTIWVIRNKSEDAPVTPLSSFTQKSTTRSESKYLLLEDSTEVWLNAASTIEFPDRFNVKKREVVLTGEAYFNVRHADKIPFIIHTGDVSTTVLGTAFNIKAYPGEKNITVSVSRGQVKVSRKDGWVTTLSKGQQVKVEEKNKKVIEKAILPSEVAAWQQGNIVYDDETMTNIINDLQRIYNVNIQIADASVHELKVSTSFKREIGIEQALQVLCRLTDKQLSNLNGSYLIK